MARGENVFQRKDGRYEARYIKGRRADGRPLYGFCYGRTYEEAKGKADRAREEIGQAKKPEAGQRPHLHKKQSPGRGRTWPASATDGCPPTAPA